MNQHVIFDTEIIGKNKPVFLICAKVVETGKVHSFWGENPAHLKAFAKFIANPNYTFVGFNSENFDRPLIAAYLMGCDNAEIKRVATEIIEGQMRSWQTYKEYGIDFFEYDHIDLMEVAPGVMISLKTYAGRMDYKTMVDMPFHHDDDLSPKQCAVLRQYCINDLGVTEALFNSLKEQLALRTAMSAEYEIDLRSKSDAQIAEAILRSRVGIGKGTRGQMPPYVTYTAPGFIQTSNKDIVALLDRIEATQFTINRGNGAVEAPGFLKDEIAIKKGSYQCGIGGLHSTHDKSFAIQATPELLISDFDVASYYPNIMLKAGLTPRLQYNQGQTFIEEYRQIYEARMAAKRAGNKVVANSLKITLNGTFGKLGSIYCSFYSPELMLAVTLTGQLNLLCLIDAIERAGGRVLSANTDGVMVAYTPAQREKLLKTIAANAKRTGFEYEETPYSRVALKDVNNYIAITTEGEVKAKGLYAEKGLQKNPTMQVCVKMAIEYLKTGVLDIHPYTDMSDFVAVRNVKGGGIQFECYEEVNDWVLCDEGWVYPGMTTKPVKRKSPPPPRMVGAGGVPFGRIARWYMTTKDMPPISYVGSGNQVPKTEGARVCMTLPDKLPKDLDLDWYVAEARQILEDIGE